MSFKTDPERDECIANAALIAQSGSTDYAALAEYVERLREAVRDLAGCVSITLELSRLKENNPNLYNPYLNKHAATIAECGE